MTTWGKISGGTAAGSIAVRFTRGKAMFHVEQPLQI